MVRFILSAQAASAFAVVGGMFAGSRIAEHAGYNEPVQGVAALVGAVIAAATLVGAIWEASK